MTLGSHWRGLPLLGAVLFCLLGAACGGGGSSQPAVKVAVSPSAVVMTVNGTQSFAAAVTGVKGVAIASSNGAVRTNGVVTITTTAAHGFGNGQTITISGVTDASFNGTFIITSVPSPTTFTFSQTGADASSGGGTVANSSVNWFVNDVQGGNATAGTITSAGLYTAPATLPQAVTATVAGTSGAVRASNVVTITTTAAHNFLVGQIVLISGVADASFNGTFLVASVPSTTTFTFNQSGNNATSGGGSISSVAVRVKAVSVVDSTASATAVVNLRSGIAISITPLSATVGTNENFQFTAAVTGSSNTSVDWLVNDTPGGSSSAGTISTNGLYTAPATPPNSNTASITSNGAVRASNVVTITTASAHGFQAGQGVIIAGVADSSFNGTFTIASVPSTTTFTYAQTGPNATSGGGTATSASTTVTIKAVAAADPSQIATATVTVTVAVDPTATSISPTVGALGALFEDVYLTGSSFISTTTVSINGTPLSSSAILAASPTVLYVRVPDSLLATAPTPPNATVTLDFSVQRQTGSPQTCTPDPTRCQLVLSPVRPAVVGPAPDSVPQGSATAVNFNVNGGYFGTALNPVVAAQFDGSTRSATVSSTNSTRQLSVTIGGSGNTSDVATPGLIQVAIRNAIAPQLAAVTNLAVQPTSQTIPTTPVATLSLLPALTPPADHSPRSVAINTATGIAVVANHDSNDLSLIDLTQNPPVVSPATIPVGRGPTSVAVDSLRNLAVVANNSDSTISVVDLGGAKPTVTLSQNIGTAPVAVGVNPLTGRALVAYQTTNNASLIDLTLPTPAVVGTVGISTGLSPQVAVQTRLNWAVVTPGGAGTLSVVDLSRQTVNSIAASSGAVRSSNSVTITTTTSHALAPGEPVLISGVGDPSFDGLFTVVSTPSATTFTYSQTGPNATSGGGAVSYSNPVATATVGGLTVSGVSINSENDQALLADPTAPSLTLFSLLDESVSSLSVGVGAAATAINPLTNIGVSVNPGANQASILDLQTPTRIATVTVGNHPAAVAIDPGTNLAVVANQNDDTISILSLGPIRPLHITEVSPNIFYSGSTLASPPAPADQTLTIIGKGFVSGVVARLDGTPLPTTFVSDRLITATVPAAMLAGPHRYALDVFNSSGPAQSNAAGFTVVQAIDMTSACTAPAPSAVAIDPKRNLGVVTLAGCNSVALIDLGSGTGTTVAVGTNPQGVAVVPALSEAVVTNRGSNNVSFVDEVGATVTATVNVGVQPLGVAADLGTSTVVVADSASNTVHLMSASASAAVGSTTTVPAGQMPVAVAINPATHQAGVANAGSSTLSLINLTSASNAGTISGFQLPTGVVFDPVSGDFLVASSLFNQVAIADPNTLQVTPLKVGINPTSVAYNFASSTLVTTNTASGTMTVVDFLARRVRATMSISASPQLAIDIHPFTNLAVIADQANNRVLLLPLPR